MLIDIETIDGPRKVRVCDYCKTVCIPHGRFCSGRCYRNHMDALIVEQQQEKDRQIAELKEWEANRNGG